VVEHSALVRRNRGRGPNRPGVSRRWIITAVENSLRRLGTDWIDLYQPVGRRLAVGSWSADSSLARQRLAARFDMSLPEN
jgi:hypothetical protein